MAGHLFNPVGAHGQNASLNTVQTLTIPSGATNIIAQAQTQNVRYTLDGTTPTASKGFQLEKGAAAVNIPIGPNTTLKFIEESASAALDYQFGN